MKIFGDTNSGNCLKVKWVCDHLRLPYRWIDLDTMKGETRTPEFLKLNSAGQVAGMAGIVQGDVVFAGQAVEIGEVGNLRHLDDGDRYLISFWPLFPICLSVGSPIGCH